LRKASGSWTPAFAGERQGDGWAQLEIQPETAVIEGEVIERRELS
jgi:hypothetical protein